MRGLANAVYTTVSKIDINACWYNTDETRVFVHMLTTLVQARYN